MCICPLNFYAPSRPACAKPIMCLTHLKTAKTTICHCFSSQPFSVGLGAEQWHQHISFFGVSVIGFCLPEHCEESEAKHSRPAQHKFSHSILCPPFPPGHLAVHQSILAAVEVESGVHLAYYRTWFNIMKLLLNLNCLESLCNSNVGLGRYKNVQTGTLLSLRLFTPMKIIYNPIYAVNPKHSIMRTRRKTYFWLKEGLQVAEHLPKISKF